MVIDPRDLNSTLLFVIALGIGVIVVLLKSIGEKYFNVRKLAEQRKELDAQIAEYFALPHREHAATDPFFAYRLIERLVHDANLGETGDVLFQKWQRCYRIWLTARYREKMDLARNAPTMRMYYVLEQAVDAFLAFRGPYLDNDGIIEAMAGHLHQLGRSRRVAELRVLLPELQKRANGDRAAVHEDFLHAARMVRWLHAHHFELPHAEGQLEFVAKVYGYDSVNRLLETTESALAAAV